MKDKDYDLRLYGKGMFTSVTEIISSAECLMYRQWKVLLSNLDFPGARVRNVILPHYEQWTAQSHCNFDFYTTQLIPGHGSFADYLLKIKRVATAMCPHCLHEIDSCEHTLSSCSAWGVLRREYEISIEINNACWLEIIPVIISDSSAWAETKKFARRVMQTKESAEMRRQRAQRHC